MDKGIIDYVAYHRREAMRNGLFDPWGIVIRVNILYKLLSETNQSSLLGFRIEETGDLKVCDLYILRADWYLDNIKQDVAVVDSFEGKWIAQESVLRAQ